MPKETPAIIILSICAIVFAGCNQATPTPLDPTATEIVPLEPTASPLPPTQIPPTAPPTEAPIVIMQDDFSDPESGWEHYNAFDGVLDYEADGYRMFVNVDENMFWVQANEVWQDVRIEVDAARTAGPKDNLYGVMCRLRMNPIRYYAFLLSSEGRYGIGKSQSGEFTWLESNEMQASAAVLGMEQVNHMAAVCEGDQLRLFVNDQLLMEATDDDLVEGDIGFAAGTVGEPGVDILFDNLIVFEP